MKEKIKVGYIGLGARGYGMLSACFGKMTDVEIAYVCDLYDERIEKTLNFFKEQGLPAPSSRVLRRVLRHPSMPMTP